MSTPRTDKEAVSLTKRAAYFLGEEWREAVNADFARTLETELQQAQAAKSLCETALAAAHKESAKLREQMDGNIEDFLNEWYCCSGEREECGCGGVTRLQQYIQEEAGTEISSLCEQLAAVTLERDEAKAMINFIRDAGWTVGTYQRVSSMHLNRGIRAEGVVGDFDGLIRGAMQSDQPYCASGLYDQLTEARAQLAACQSREAKALEELARITGGLKTGFPFPLSRDGSTVLTCDGLPFCRMEPFDDQQKLRLPNDSVGSNALTRFAQVVVDAVNHYGRVAQPPEIGTSATPRTDAEIYEEDTGLNGMVKVVSPNFARKLERELATAEADRDQLQAQVGRYERYLVDIRDKAALIANGGAEESERFVGRQVILMASSALAVMNGIVKAPAAPDSAKDAPCPNDHDGDSNCPLCANKKGGCFWPSADSAKDGARLEAIQNHHWQVAWNDRIAAFTVQAAQQVCGCIGRGPTLRAAIDAAMAATPPKPTP